ncbi:2OG-Fe dioxygenase family protein [Tenacibaculum caenipelagi]|uniref:2-oxoglutarate-Fe(II)-dependent dioxygenase family protein n=1 Tax=Tenacibaculum caenipelagi TaxID=1325435 RepID=A0A4R6TJS2_9FLAO|nr:2OG-Fe dioxygenase family protein [Tenacibaculum caenipelagi]TDQ28491.1 2-oxoglutarate-Fe(II)-dependent dioxygenase family protein [Tenacibaculum caenipelagi]
MITEQHISETHKREIKSPIRIASLSDLNINKEIFIGYFQPLFENLEDDLYLVRENQIAFLKATFPEDIKEIEEIHQAYFHGKVDEKILTQWTFKLTMSQMDFFKQKGIVTRQRSVAAFIVEKEANNYHIERVLDGGFSQNVDDFRSWQRVFKQADKEMVEHDLFYELLQKVYELVAIIHTEIKKLKFSVHFMRTLTQGTIQGENSPEGVHEDGAQYIISALVINRKNITGGETQIFEKIGDTKELLFKKELNLGEFAFQADTGEEKIFGNDLWHYVTPIQPKNKAELGVRDIIGLDIEILR